LRQIMARGAAAGENALVEDAMETRPQITFRGLDKSPNLTSIIEEKLDKLETFYDRITSCRVAVERRSSQGHKGHIYAVDVELEVPGGTIIVNRKPGDTNAHEDPRVAIRDSFDAARRQLEDHVRKTGGIHVKPEPEKRYGRIVRVFAEEGYGFALMEDGQEVFFDRSSVTGTDWDTLDLDAEVSFALMTGEKGPYAANLSLRG
jgi:cold shock CspA family protein/ribosome-associated translation inhibitor RaiA